MAELIASERLKALETNPDFMGSNPTPETAAEYISASLDDVNRKLRIEDSRNAPVELYGVLASSGRTDLIDMIGAHKYGYADPDSTVMHDLMINAFNYDNGLMMHIAKKWRRISQQTYDSMKSMFVDMMFCEYVKYKKMDSRNITRCSTRLKKVLMVNITTWFNFFIHIQINLK